MIKNLRLNKKKIAAILMAGNILAFCGCSKKPDDSFIRDTFVVTYLKEDMEIKDVVEKEKISTTHVHYKSLITGEVYTNKKFCLKGYKNYDILECKHIPIYLTNEEVMKFSKNEITFPDKAKIIKRVIGDSYDFYFKNKSDSNNKTK